MNIIIITNYRIWTCRNYIINNTPSIYAYLIKDPNVRKVKDLEPIPGTFIDEKFLLVQSNINTVIQNMAAYDIPLPTLLNYFCGYEMSARLQELLLDNGDIFKNYYASYIMNQSTCSDVMTCVKLTLQNKVMNTITMIKQM